MTDWVQIYGDLASDGLADDHKEVVETIELLSKTSKLSKHKVHLPSIEELPKQHSFCRVLSPEEPIKIIWDLIGMVFIFVQMITIPLIITFSLESIGFLGALNLTMDIYFIVDIFVSFQTGYFQDGTLKAKRIDIAKNYLRSWFWIDLISSFPYDHIIEAFANDDSAESLQAKTQILKMIRFLRFVKIIRLIRAIKLKKLINQLEDYLFLDNTITSLIMFLKICIIILCIAHWCACIWNGIRIMEDKEDNWYTSYELHDPDESNWSASYVDGIYFSVTTMITIGYGDIHPVTIDEQIFGIFMMILSSGLFGYTMNMVTALFQNNDLVVNEIMDQSDILMKYIKQKKLQVARSPVYQKEMNRLQSRVKSYLDWLVEQDSIQRNYEQNTLKDVSKGLQQELFRYKYGQIMTKIKCLDMNFPKEISQQISTHFRERIYNPEELIIHQNERIDDSTCLFYIQHGTVATCIEQFNPETKQKSYNIIKKLNKANHQYFGEISFFGNVQRSCSVISTGFSSIYYIRRADFVRILDAEALQTWFKIKFAVEQKNNYAALLDLTCFACEQQGHIVKYCPVVHYQISGKAKESLVKQSRENLRAFILMKRSRRRKINSVCFSNSELFKNSFQKIAVERNNIIHFLSKKQDQDQAQQGHYQQWRGNESFASDTIKEFKNFSFNFNFQQVVEPLNAVAERQIKQLEDERARSKAKMTTSKIMGLMKKKQADQMTKSIRLQEIVKSVISSEKSSQTLLKRNSSDEKKHRLQSIQFRRHDSQIYSQSQISNQFLQNQSNVSAISEDINESPAQTMKKSKSLTFQKSNKSTISTAETQLYPDIYEVRPKRRTMSLQVSKDKISSAFSKKQLENMIYIVINHKLFNQK